MLFSMLPLEFNSLLFHLLKALQGLQTVGFVLFSVLSLQLHCFLIQLLPALEGFLLELLAACGELLFLLSNLRLHLLLELGVLLTCVLQQLFTLLTGLIPQLGDLAFGLLADRGTVHQLLALSLSLLNDVVSLLSCIADKTVAPFQQFRRALNFLRQRFTHGIKNFHGIRFIHHSAAAEWKTAPFENHFLQLIQLIENVEPDVAHLTGEGKPN